MNPLLVAGIIGGYFLILIFISVITSKNADAETFYTGNRRSPWYLVAFGMIGASLSGVTFISVPGEVGSSNWYYFQMVLGYLLGYLVIGTVLMPLYYRMNLVSIYTYLEDRFGFWSYKSGAFFFLLSRIIGSSFRLYLVAGVLQIAFFDAFGLPFWVAVLTSVVLIWLYTFRGGIRTIVWTDTLQTTFMIASVIISISYIKDSFSWDWWQLAEQVTVNPKSQVFNWDWQHSRHFVKEFFAGAFIAIVMTGLDQDMMQKNLTCKNLKDAQKNMLWFSLTLVVVKLMFLTLGVLLYMYAEANQIGLPERTDQLFPMLAVNYFPLVGGIVFLLGITAAAYSSADSALTALTTSFCVDFLGFNKENFANRKHTKAVVHLGFTFLLFLVILAFNAINDQSVINSILKVAGYTYGPLLGLFSFGIFTRWQVRDNWVPYISIAAPLLSYLINAYSEDLLWGYRIGFEILIINGFLVFVGLYLGRKKTT